MAKILRKRDTQPGFTRYKCFTLSVMAVSLLALAAAPQPDVDAERQLQQAIHLEIVAGDLKGAMEIYRTLLSQPPKSKFVSARATFQLAQCLEKEGRPSEARALYNRVLADYADQTEIVRQANLHLIAYSTSASGPRNLNFSEGVPGRVPPGWMVPSLPKDANYLAELRRDGCRSSIGCVVVLVPANAPGPFSQLMQSFTAGPYRGATVRLRGWLRIDASRPDDRAQMWLSIDRENHRRGFFDNMEDRPVRSAEWTRCEITGKVDDDATFIDIGIMSTGSGRVWADDVSFEVISRSKTK